MYTVHSISPSPNVKGERTKIRKKIIENQRLYQFPLNKMGAYSEMEEKELEGHHQAPPKKVVKAKGLTRLLF